MRTPLRASTPAPAKTGGRTRTRSKGLRICLAAILAVFTLTVAFVAAQPATTLAASTSSIVRLHQYTGNPISYTQYASGEKTDLKQKGIVNVADMNAGYAFWHFVDPNKGDGTASVTFIDAAGKEVVVNCVKSYKNGQHFGVITPIEWKLLDAKYSTTAPKLFNLSHTEGYPVKPPTTAVSTTIATTVTKPSSEPSTVPTTEPVSSTVVTTK